MKKFKILLFILMYTHMIFAQQLMSLIKNFNQQSLISYKNLLTNDQINMLLIFLLVQKFKSDFKNIGSISGFKYGLSQLSFLTNHYSENDDKNFISTVKTKLMITALVFGLFYISTFVFRQMNVYCKEFNRWFFESKKNMFCAYLMHFKIVNFIQYNLQFYHDFEGEKVMVQSPKNFEYDRIGTVYKTLNFSRKFYYFVCLLIKGNIEQQIPDFYHHLFTIYNPLIIEKKYDFSLYIVSMLFLYTFFLIKESKVSKVDYIILFLMSNNFCSAINSSIILKVNHDK